MLNEFIAYKLRQMLTEQRVKFHMDIPEDIKLIEAVFDKNNRELYICGGAVRDTVLGHAIKDYDLVTNAVPDEVIRMLKGQPFVKNIIETGKSFGVINVLTANDEYEIATMREDIYNTPEGGRRPDSVVFGSIEKDAGRRDLSCNALYYDLKTNEIIDLVGGLEDIKNNVIRTVGSPTDRFKEDRLRIMRFLRFICRFGSDLDPEADKALKQDSSLEGISSERIRDEFLKGIKSAKSVNRFIAMLNMYDMFKWIFGSLRVDLTASNEERDTIVLIANLLRQNDPNAVKTQLNKLTYTGEEIGKISFLLALLKFRPEMIMSMKKLEALSKITPEQIKEFSSHNNLDSHLIDAFLNFKLSVKADEFMNAGMKAGPELGQAINKKEIELLNQTLQ